MPIFRNFIHKTGRFPSFAVWDPPMKCTPSLEIEKASEVNKEGTTYIYQRSLALVFSRYSFTTRPDLIFGGGGFKSILSIQPLSLSLEYGRLL